MLRARVHIQFEKIFSKNIDDASVSKLNYCENQFYIPEHCFFSPLRPMPNTVLTGSKEVLTP